MKIYDERGTFVCILVKFICKSIFEAAFDIDTFCTQLSIKQAGVMSYMHNEKSVCAFFKFGILLNTNKLKLLFIVKFTFP